jgi:TolB protein
VRHLITPRLRSLLTVLAVVAGSSIAHKALAQTGDEELPPIIISNAGVQMLCLAVPRAEGDNGAVAVETMSKDMDITGLFQVLDPASFPQQLQSEGMAFSSALWTQVGAQVVIKMKASGGQLEGKLFVVARGDQPTLTKTYHHADIRDAIHEFANDIVQSTTGKRGVFGSRIAFAMSGHGSHEIGSIDMDGGRMAVLTKMASDSLLPAYSPGGAEIAFTSYARNNPDLWIVSSGGGRARRVSKQPGLNTGASWSPDGRVIALTLSHEGNSEIYRVSPDDGRVLARLTQSPAIDSSPSFSPDGSQIAFVSNRQGSPQIFVMPATGGGAKRVTFQGKYNQTPRFNPRTDKPQIAFTGRDEKGVFDVFILDLKANKIDRVAPLPPLTTKVSNLDPTWSPDGRLLAYTSSRGGIWVYNPETHHEVQISKGGTSSPSWGPAPRR